MGRGWQKKRGWLAQLTRQPDALTDGENRVQREAPIWLREPTQPCCLPHRSLSALSTFSNLHTKARCEEHAYVGAVRFLLCVAGDTLACDARQTTSHSKSALPALTG